MRKASRSIRNSLFLIVGQGTAQIASALTFLILARSLDLAHFGILATLYGAALFLSILIDFGSSSYSTRELSVRPKSTKFAGQYRSRNILTSLAILLPITALLFPSFIEIAIAVCLSFVLAHERFISAPLRAAMNMGKLATVSAAEKLLVLLATYGLAQSGIINAAAFLTTSLITSLAGCVIIRLLWRPRYVAIVINPRSKRLVSPFAGVKHLGLTSVAIGLQSLDSAVIALTAGASAAGLYAAVGRWTQPLGLVTQAVTQAAFSEMVSANRHADAFRSLRLHLGMLAVASVPLIVVFCLADELTMFLLGPEYAGSTAVLQMLAGAVLFGVISSPLSSFLQARSDESFTSRVFLIAMPAQLALMCLLASLGGAGLGALAVLIIQGFLAITLSTRSWWLLQKEAKSSSSSADSGSLVR